MAVPQGAFLAAVPLLVSSLLLCSSSSRACPQSCTCGRAPLLNCSSAGLSSVPQHIQDSVTELDLSHNLLKSVTLHRPHHNLRSVWLGNNSIPHLSVCIGRNLEGQYLRDTHRSGPWKRRRCVSWAPTLQLLSVERNQLEQLPEGLEGIESLQVLHLSFNRISTLQPGDLSHLQQLKELHLQHNLITSLHPQIFQDLAQLKVLDLSFNMLTSLHPLMYLTLHNIGTDVRLLGNRWQCDCRMHSLRRRMAFDRDRGLQVWSITCASPAVFSGRDLLHLQDDDLNCLSAVNIPDLHQDVTVYSGSEILLSCSAEDSMWWTPSGQTSVNQPEGGLLISDITERDTGLYVCVSEEKQVVSIFNLQISKIGGARRKPRSLSGTSQHIIQQGSNRIGREINPRAGPTQSDLVLAVCLSIFITFLIAFILGVLARPCVDVYWKKVTKKKNSCETNTVVSVEQRQYDNEAFSNGEETEVIGHHRERRVTFSTVDYREGSNVQYYDTVASGNQESINNAVVIECEVTEAKNIKHIAEDSGSESGSHQSSSEDRLNGGRDHTSAGHRYNMEFEPIPDPDELEEKKSLSSLNSDSSLSEKEFKEDRATPKYPKLTEDPVQQKADFSVATKVDGPQISTNSKNEMPSFTSNPWLPHADNRNPTDPGDVEENGELFEFSDSVQSPSSSSGSMFDSFKKSKNTVASTSEKQKKDSVSSSSSHISQDELTFYNVNPDQHEAHFKKHAVRPDHSFSSDSSEDEPEKHTNKLETDKDTRVKITPKPRTKWRGVYWDTSQSKSLDANESNLDKKTQLHISIAPLEVSQTIGHNAKTKWPDREHKTDMKVSSPASYSSSSSDSGDETHHKVQQSPGKMGIAPRPFQESSDPNAKWPTIDLKHIPHIKRRLDIKTPSAGSHTSSSSDSEEDTPKKQEHGGVQMPILPNRSSQKVNHEHEIRRPPIPPERLKSFKKSDSSSSSSSDSEDETHHKVQQSPGKLGIAPRPFQESSDPNAKWPTIDLKHIPHIKRRLDIKTPSADSHTSSSSDSEEDTPKKQEHGGVQMPILPNRSSQKVNHEHEIRRPPIPPERLKSFKKSDSSSSSSSDSEDETHHKVQQSPGKLGIAPRPFQEHPDPNAKWPTIDLKHIPHIKRRLDIKTPSAGSHTSSSSDSEEDTPKKQEHGGLQMPILPNRSSQKVNHEHEIRRPPIPPERPKSFKKSNSSSSSSSDSEDETHHKVQQSPGKLGIAPRPFQESSDPNAKWPAIDLKHIPHIKRRLDIKTPSAGSHTSSSSDSEEDTPKKQEHGCVQMPILPNRSSQKVNHEHEIRRPPIPPERLKSFKKSDSSSSSSSDSEDETHHKVQQSPGKLGIAPRPFQECPDPNAKWPTIDLKHIPHIKRRLDIKTPSAGSHTSSSSDSEEDTPKKQEHAGVQMPILPNRSSQKVNHEHEIRRPPIPPERPKSFKKSDSSSSSSSDSEDETHHKVQQSPGKLGIAPRPFQERPDPNAKWPTIDLKHIPHIKRRLDIKTPSAGSHTSSSSDSEEDTPKKQEHGGVQMPILPNRSSQKVNHEHEIRRPPIPPERPKSFKKSDSSSSSSSDSEDETHHKVQQSPGKLGIAPRPFQERPDPNAKWPTIDLKHIPHIKRRLDIKTPSAGSHTSSSSDSEEDTPKKQEHAGVQMPILPNRSSQKVNHEHEIRRPPIPPERPKSFKKSDSSSSSSSDSEDETHHKVQQSPGKLGIAPRPFQERPDPNAKWPTIDLKHIPHIKRRLDIKTPSAGSHTSSSSDSEEDTPKKQEHAGVQMPILPNRSSQKVNHEHEIRRPPIPPERPKSFKKSDSSSSSSSDSEDETHHKVQQSPGKLGIAPRPFQERPDPNAKWPTIDLKHIPHIKRRLDIKTPSAGSHTSSSSDSEEDTPKKQEHAGVQMPILPNRSSQKVNHEHEIRRPPIPPERLKSFKKSDSSSSSSSDSEDETHHKVQQSPGKLGIAPRPFQERPDPNAKWPTIDLKHIPHIKRRLDIKTPSAGSHTSSSSDSEEDTPKKQEHAGVQMPILPNRSSQKVNHEHEIRRPPIPPERPKSFKKSDSSSSSSSDSEDETHHKVQQSPGKLGIAPRPFQERPDPNAKWPTIDLKHIPHIKRRLDIKTPSAGSHTSSSSDSEEDTPKKQEHAGVQMPILPNRSSQKVNHEHEIRRPPIPPERLKSFKKSDSSSSSSSDSEDETHHKVQQSPGKLGIAPRPFQERPDPNAKWPTIDLKHIPHIKRRLDIKTPSAGSHTSSSSDSEEDTPKKQEHAGVQMPILPNRSSQKVNHEHEIRRPPIPPERPKSFKKSDSSSSSSSDSEDETHHKVQQSPGKLGIAPRPFQEHPDPNAKWPTIDLKHIPHIKRRLDIKTPSAGSHTSSSSDSEEDTPKKQEHAGVQMPILPNRPSQKVNHEHEIRRPPIPPERPKSFKKSDSSSSSSSDSEDETHHKVQQSPGKLGIAPRPFQERPDPNAKWPTIDLKHIPHIKRRLDIKAPSAGSHTSSSSDSEEDTPKKQEHGGLRMPRQPTELSQTKSQYVKTQRPGIHFKHITEVKAPSLSSSGSDSEDENRGYTEKQKLVSTGFPFQQSQTKSLDPSYTSSSSDEQKERTEVFKDRPVTVKPDSRSPEMGLSSTPYVKKRLDIKARSPKSSSSSDESEGKTTDLPVKVDSNLRSPKSTLFNVPQSSRKDPNINLEKYVIITDDLGDKPKDNISTTPDINSELQSRWATMNLGISRFRKRLEITSPRHQPSNQKRNHVQEIMHTQTDSSLNLQNKPVKPSDSSTSCSSSEDEITENRVPPGMTYIDNPITYKRSIIKTSSLPDNSFSLSSKSQIINVAQESERDRSTSLAPKRVSSLSFEDTVRRKIEQKQNTDVDIPPEIRWTGVGHYLSNLSTPTPTSPQQASSAKPEPPPLYSASIKRDTKIKEDTWKSDLMPTHKFSSISTSSASSASGGALYRLYNSPNTTYEAPSTVLDDRKERRGLSALKTMSSERKMWDTEDFSEGDVHSPQAGASLYHLKSELDIKPLPKPPKTQLHLPSASPDKTRAMDLLYGVPRYRGHDIKPPQVAPPPIPATLKPDEAVGLTRRAPQGSEKQGLEGNRSYEQQTQNTEEPGSPSLASEYPPIYLNTSNITHV